MITECIRRQGKRKLSRGTGQDVYRTVQELRHTGDSYMTKLNEWGGGRGVKARGVGAGEG